MAQPVNDILIIATEALGADGFSNKVAPIAPVTTKGYGEQSLTYQQLNYLHNTHGNWLKYINEEQIPEEAAARILADTTNFNNLQAQITALTAQVVKERVSVGEIIEITGDGTNPANLKGYGVWSSWGAGVSLVGVGSHLDDRGETKVWADGNEEGEYKHVQTETEMAQHDHPDTFAATTANDTHDHTTSVPSDGTPDGNTDISSTSSSGSFKPVTSSSDTHNHPVTVTGAVQNAGSSGAMNNTQPTRAVYRWKRTS